MPVLAGESAEPTGPPVANAIWVGGALGPLHALCLASFVRAGHRTVLHCYERPVDLPDGVETADARRLMPESRIIGYRRGGSFSLFSNLFRLKILEAGLGFYVDCDVFCLRPFPDADYLFGFETDYRLNGAVLKMPPQSPMLRDFLRIDDRHFIPPWFSAGKRGWLGLRQALGLPAGIETYGWGELGPRATTYFARQAGVLDKAQPADVFYPVPFERVGMFLDPGLSIEDISTSRTLGIHLYHEALKRQMTGPVAATSPLGRMFARCDRELPLTATTAA
ncbi:MAG: hypothetical protein P4M09_12335 [Devosia sp.]|nr:hypothetical protein [Devosia sp.]